jgi:hypothetical protein
MRKWEYDLWWKGYTAIEKALSDISDIENAGGLSWESEEEQDYYEKITTQLQEISMEFTDFIKPYERANRATTSSEKRGN